MENVTRVGIDLGKQVFHVTAVDAAGRWWNASGCGVLGCSRI